MRGIFRLRWSAAVATAVLASMTAAGCDRESPVAPSPQCTFTLSSSGQSFASDGGKATVSITTQPQCAWTATSAAAWITFEGPSSGVGPGTVTAVIAANSVDQTRSGSIAVAGQNLSFSQEAAIIPCAFDISPARATHGAEGGEGTLHVSTRAECAWTATTGEPWLRITSGEQGRGDGDVTYLVAENTLASERTGTLVVAERSIDVTQTGAAQKPPPEPPPAICDYGVTPLEFTLHWHHTGDDITLTTGAGCGWTATPGAEWLSLATPQAGSGAAVIRFAHSIYIADGSRRAPVQVRWPTPTAGQNVWVTQEGCRYGISENNRDVPAAGATVTMYVYQQAVSSSCAIPCPWTAVPSAPWIRIITSMPHAGDDQLMYRVDPNPTGQTRAGTIRIESQVVIVRQAAGGGPP